MLPELYLHSLLQAGSVPAEAESKSSVKENKRAIIQELATADGFGSTNVCSQPAPEAAPLALP